MNAEIITIGDELLIGQVADLNATFIGKELTRVGVEVNQVTTIKDRDEDILKALKQAYSQSEIVLVTGGLGPTKDDKTKAVFCQFFEDKLVESPETLRHIKTLFNQKGTPLLPANIDQAKVPSKARVLENKCGTAPGMWFEKEGVVFVAMPGVPYEMKAMMTDLVIPQLVDEFERDYIEQKTVLTYGEGESQLAERISQWEDNLPDNMSLAYLPRPGGVRLRVMIRGKDRANIKAILQNRLKALTAIIDDIIGGFEGDQLWQEQIAQKLTEKQLTLAIAESCTGGKIASLFTEIPGASAYFKGGLIPYSTAIKTKVLGVPPEIIATHSVVSAQTAVAMARKTQVLFQSDFGLATTGNAGPTKGDSSVAIGTVFIALAVADKVYVEEFHLGNHREKVVEKAVLQALGMLKNQLN